MPVFTAAVIAVTAAVATTTMATVATAAIAVSAAVGVAGLAVGAVGMVTKNKDLMFAGKIMGYVGMAGGLAGGLIGGAGALMNGTGTFMEGAADAFAGYSQNLSQAWEGGVGSWFSGGEQVAGQAGNATSGAADVAKTADQAVTSSSPVMGGKPMAAFPEVQPSPTATSTIIDESSRIVPSSVSAPAPQAGGVSAPVSGSVATPQAPITQVPGVPTISGYTPITGPQNTIAAQNLIANTPAASGNGLVSTVSNMPDWMKYSMMTTGAQGVTGLAGGYFQGQQAEAARSQQQTQMDRDQAYRELIVRQANEIPAFRRT